MKALRDFYSEHTVHGRRAYTCQFCPRPIEKGTLHVHVAHCTDGKVSGRRAHLECHEAATGQAAPAPERRSHFCQRTYRRDLAVAFGR